MRPLTLYEQPSLAVPQALDRIEFLGQELYAFCGASGWMTARICSSAGSSACMPDKEDVALTCHTAPCMAEARAWSRMHTRPASHLQGACGW